MSDSLFLCRLKKCNLLNYFQQVRRISKWKMLVVVDPYSHLGHNCRNGGRNLVLATLRYVLPTLPC